ncbi:virulence RhuM family protein [uncultured Winogradskyella sp.]|uniref:virulence RhuM family protein n=2 Tax=Flavobacteriaceae TaxID=49546 RepID=UPI0030DD58EB|tara:strand:- start:4922 stop:5962 length:1041 start_codon:yes stop_codon:yes gene_type:complete
MKEKDKNIKASDELSDFILYTAPSGEVRIEIYVQNETVWLTQQKIADLFGVDRTVVTKHLKNIYTEGELEKTATSAKYAQVQKEGEREVKRNIEFYNLDAIISVGYRVNSTKATQFRIWATKTLKEYIIKGFTIDDERLKQGKTLFGKDYFKELLERVRSIRASERRIYQQVTDIFAECSIDYDPQATITKKFYATVQNKFHYAITGKTAAEIIYLKADSKKENMGLTTWKNAPDGRVIKSDTSIAKNYLQEKEIKQLERTVTGYFDYIEGLIERENTFTMEQLALSVNKFLAFNEYKVLEGLGKKSKKQAENKAFSEYDKFNKTQKIESDFDKMVKGLKKGKKQQ